MTLYLLVSCVHQQFAIYVLRLDSKALLNQMFAFLCVVFAIWAMGDALIFTQNSEIFLPSFYKVASFGWSLFPAAVLNFNIHVVFRKKTKARSFLSLILFRPAIFFVFQTLTSQFVVKEFLPISYGWKLISDTSSVWYQLYQVYYLIGLIGSCGVIFYWMQKTRIKREKEQARLMFYTGILTAVLGISQDFLLSFVHFQPLPALHSVYSLIWVCGIWLAITRYNLMDLTPELASTGIIQSMKDIMFLLDTQGNIIRINRQAEVILGFMEEAVKDKPFIELIGDKIKFEEAIRGMKNRSENEAVVDTILTTRWKKNIQVEVYFSQIRDRSSKVIGTVIVAHDLRQLQRLKQEILDRKKIEIELLDTLTVLKQRNDEIDHDLRFAQKIQRNYIPSQIPDKNIGLFYKATEKIGGDFCDIIRFRGSKKIGVFISDVSGHGVAAAMITSMIKSFISQAGEYRNDPAGLLTYLNTLLADQIAGNFVTAFYGIVDPEEKTLFYSLAGHNLPVILRDEEIFPLESKFRSIPLAVLTEDEMKSGKKSYKNGVYNLKKEDKIIFYTDGLIESRSNKNPDICFEDGDMQKAFLDNAGLCSRDFAMNVYQLLVEFSGGDHFEDDVCFVCVQV